MAWTFLGRGNNGAVFRRDDHVAKWTVDPVETQAWLATAALRCRGRAVPGMPRIRAIHLGHRQAVILREDVRPLPARSHLDPGAIRHLQLGSRIETRGRLLGNRQAINQGRRLRDRALWGALGNLRGSIHELQRMGAAAPDVRPDNIGHAADGRLLLLDPGRAPIETTLVAPGEADAACPNEAAVHRAVHQILGHAPDYTSCRIVSPAGLAQVMQDHGWSRREINGTAGFHGEDGRISILRGQEWSQLHEHVHAAGVVDRSLASWATEGITEAAAQDIARRRRVDHRPTYPEEVAIVRRQLGPLTGLTPLQLANLVASNQTRASAVLAQRLGEYTTIPARQWRRGLDAGVTSPRHFEQLAAQARRRR